MLFRCIIKLETRKLFLGKTYGRKWFLIIKNEHNKHFKKGNDYNFFANRYNGFIIDRLEPISDEEAYKIAS